MKITLPNDGEGFKITPQVFCGIDSLLIIPGLDPAWNTDNLHLRSLIVSRRGKTILSCGFKKFFNEGEKVALYPPASNFNDLFAEAKCDGTLVIVDYCNKQFSMRTRGTASYTFQQNSKDFELLLEEHPRVLDVVKENKEYSFLFELETPNNVIVIRNDVVKFTFLGAISKNTLLYMSDEELNHCSALMGVPRPQKYNFGSVLDLSLLVKEWKGKEGVVVSYNNFQNKIKIKSDWYLFIHRVKSQLNSDNNLIDFYLEKNMPDYDIFYKIIETEFDFEIAVQLKNQLTLICNAGLAARKYINTIKDIVKDIRNVPTRKEQANMITRNFQENSSLAFSVLDEKELTKFQWTKLLKLKLEVEYRQI